MSETLKVAIVFARCQANRQPFGIRFEQAGTRTWAGVWAFPMREETAKREGYDRTHISGEITLTAAYPGCPHCRSASIVRCGSCTHVTCLNAERHEFACPWCGNQGHVSGSIDHLDVGGDS